MPHSSLSRPRAALAATTALTLALGATVLLGASATAAGSDRIAIALPTAGPVTTTNAASTALLPGWKLPTGKSNDGEITASSQFRVSNGLYKEFFSHLGYYTPVLGQTAGETGTGDVNTFDASFTVASATGGYQDRLNIGVTFEDVNQGGSRYGGHLYFIHSGGLLKVVNSSFDLAAQAPFSGAIPSANIVWTETVLADLDPTVSHDIRAIVHFVDGPSNDYIEVYADGTSLGTVLTLEGFFEAKLQGRNKVGSLGFESGPNSVSTQGLTLISEVSAPVAANLGNGFLFSNIAYSSYDIVPVAPTAPAPILAPAPAAVPDDVLELPATSDPSGTVEVSGSGFEPYENVHFTWYSTPTFAGWAQADAFGNVSATFAIPAGFSAGQTHTLQAVGERSARVVNSQITLSAAAAALAATGPTEQLLLGVSGVGILLLLAGGGLILMVTRKRALL